MADPNERTPFHERVNAAFEALDSDHDRDLELMAQLGALADEELDAVIAAAAEDVGRGIHIYATAETLLARRTRRAEAKGAAL